MPISLAMRFVHFLLPLGFAATPSFAQSWREDVLSPRGMLDRHVTCDFNSDGTQDVLGIGTALSTSGSRAAFLYLGNGDGTFLRVGKVQRGLVQPDRLIACDVNGDGSADAVLFNASTGSVVLLEGGGDGTFGAPRLLAAVGGSGSEVLGSLRCFDDDGDGDLDLYFSARNIGAASGIYWIEQMGPGVFAPPLVLTPPAFAVFSFDVADLDGDGDSDVVAAAGQQGLVWFRNDGGATPTGPFTIQSGLDAGRARDVRSFDVDRDGKLDLIGTNNFAGSRVVYYRNTGAGAFASAVQIEQATDPVNGFVFGDLDGDGHDDIAFEQVRQRCAAVLVSAGSTFSPRFPVVSPADEIGALDLADVDGDGRADAVFSGRLYYNIVGGTEPPVLGFWRNLGPSGSGVTFEPNIRIEPFGYYTTGVEVADVTGDGAPDLIVAGGQPRPLVIYDNGGDGTLAKTIEIPVDGKRVQSIAAADVDGDHDIDLMYSVDTGGGTVLFLARNDGDGSSWSVAVYDPGGFGALGVGDLEGDGDDDMLVVISQPPAYTTDIAVAENLGAGTVSSPRALVSLPSYSYLRGSSFKDVDGDGDADVVLGVINSIGGTVHQLQYFRADAGGAYTGPTVLDSSPGYLAQVSPRGFSDIEVADFDGDGDQDIVALAQYVTGGAVRLYRQTSPSVFGPPEVIVPTPATGGGVGLDAFDGDADGDLDLLVTLFRSSTEAADVLFYENAGGGSFLGAVAASTVGVDPSYIGSGDFDLDGDVDFVTSGYWIDDDEHFSIFTNDLYDTLGSDYCLPAVANSTGSPGVMTVVGSSLVQDNVARLRAWNLPPSTAGFFLTSRTPGRVVSVPGSMGILCLGGQIGRFAGPGQVKNTGSTGTMALDVDLQAFPNPAVGTVSVLAGEHWYFQGWTRDAVGGMVTSNFTAPTTVTWQ